MAQSQFFAITPSDSVALQQPVSWIYVGVTGNIAVKGVGDSAASVITAAPVGWMRFPAPVATVMATSTTATTMVGAIGDETASH